MLREPSPEDVELGLLGRPVSAGPWRGEMSDQRLKPPCCETLMGTLFPQMTTTTTPPASHPPLSPSLRPAPLPLGPSRLPPLPLSRWFLRSDPSDRQTNRQSPSASRRPATSQLEPRPSPPLPAFLKAQARTVSTAPPSALQISNYVKAGQAGGGGVGARERKGDTQEVKCLPQAPWDPVWRPIHFNEVHQAQIKFLTSVLEGA